ncbi:MAG: ABC-F family ATP-binding cassette domain-containing protein [Deltaproteobacteria bacterium]|nr:ABC-F family ATP-binding cassette domain-containing protein [Deltaproteobacteria bacterium]
MEVLLQLKNIEKHYGARAIFEKASVAINSDQKIGVIGRNGAGKSTLCRMMTGVEEVDGGEIVKNSLLRIGYLEQHDPYQLHETILEFLIRYTHRKEWKCGKIAAKFEMAGELLNTKIENLSGGYRTRVKLAAMLLMEPNLLILDEPTNFLDLHTLILLEEFFNDFEGAFLIVSHDREFLKNTCTHTLEVENGDLTLYPGNVEEYLAFKEEQLEHALRYNKNIEDKRRQLQAFVDRFRAKASKAAQAQSKLRQMEKLSRIEIAHSGKRVKIRIPSVEKRKGLALQCKEFAIGYPNHLVARHIHLAIPRGTRVAVLGDNGEGKTTFLRTLAGSLSPISGTYRWGYGVEFGYYAQHVYSALSSSSDVYSHLERHAAEGVTRQDILETAGTFLFRGNDVEKKISILSGGERARLCLAALLLTKNDVLLLDEPTNHLDFETVEALGGALRDYNGTLFFVSHDRTFVNLLATDIIEVREGSITRYPGSYQDYVYHLQHRVHVEVSAVTQTQSLRQEGSSPRMSSSHEQRKLWQVELRKTKSESKKIETQIDRLTQEKNALLAVLVAHVAEYSRERYERLQELNDLLEKEEQKWLNLQAKMEELSQKKEG